MTTGTREWADSNINIQQGCKNGCLYCYAAQMAIRFKRSDSLYDWTANSKIDLKKVDKNYRKRKGVIMFPSSHDIFPENLDAVLTVLKKLLSKGNQVLLVTKPDLYCIKMICEVCNELGYKDQIQFRFTITSLNNALLHKWEPYATYFPERMASLKYAAEKGFKTSVSIEPFLDLFAEDLIAEVEPWVTDTIWIGLMNTTTLPKKGRELYKSESMTFNYDQARIARKLPAWKAAANGKLRLKDSIRDLLNY